MNVAWFKAGVHITKLAVTYAEIWRNGKRRVAGFNSIILFAFNLCIYKSFKFRSRHNWWSRVNAVHKRNLLKKLHFGFGIALFAVLFTIFIKSGKQTVCFICGADKFVVDIKTVTFVYVRPGIAKDYVCKFLRFGKVCTAYGNYGILRSSVYNILNLCRSTAADYLFRFIIGVFVFDIGDSFSVGFKCKSVVKIPEVLDGEHKKNSSHHTDCYFSC